MIDLGQAELKLSSSFEFLTRRTTAVLETQGNPVACSVFEVQPDLNTTGK